MCSVVGTPGPGLETTEIVHLKMKISTLLSLICLAEYVVFVRTRKTCSDHILSGYKMYLNSSHFNLAHTLSSEAIRKLFVVCNEWTEVLLD